MAEDKDETVEMLRTLPGDEVRQIMWRFAERFDLQMVVQSARSVARGPVARLVAEGGRNTHDWTEGKAALLGAYDEAGLTSVFMEPEYGGFIEGPKNMALALVAFELAWVDGGSATCSLAGHLALSPIHERGTPEQVETYMSRCVPLQPGEDRQMWRGAFALTEPLPYVGVDTGVVSGRIRVAEWEDGKEPTVQVDKRGRFITNMDFANFVVAAVTSDEERIKGSCMVILEEDDPGTYDRGAPTLKLVHQLSSTRDPILSLQVPASRIVGGYEVVDGVIVPNYSHGEVIDAVFRRTRVTVGLMTSAKLLSAVEPVVRYQRNRFRGGDAAEPGSPRYEMGLQQREDVLHRLVDVWATGEASASLGFAAARLFDEYDPMESQKNAILAEQGASAPRAQMRALRKMHTPALEYLGLAAQPEDSRDTARLQELESDPLVVYLVKDAVANVLCPACKLWNTGHGANMMREAVSLMGGYGITEDCPGFLGQKWMDAQLEATYEGPEAVQRRQLSVTMTNEIFLAHFREWISEMRRIASQRPGTGACTLASAMALWEWTLRYLLEAKDADGKVLYRDSRQGVTFPMADALCWLLASRYQILDTIELEEKGADNPALADGLPGYVAFFTDLCHLQAARASGEAGRICAELAFGYNRHPGWDAEGASCYGADDLAALEGVMPGIASGAESTGDVIGADGSHADKAGPCACFEGMETFVRLRTRLDGCLSGARLAKDRAAKALSQVMIPEALDYPL
ncbi:MAG: acyl-CoA dehydrogenase family protein [Candidatus Latescibacteria bacterium]|jgi:alkylation response protein AidB-like acyl-CoA dehydrogenase|nr:acyl-CoA dehydrogenase family protein [Candidatus Latescibacterota bacterium]